MELVPALTEAGAMLELPNLPGPQLKSLVAIPSGIHPLYFSAATIAHVAHAQRVNISIKKITH